MRPIHVWNPVWVVVAAALATTSCSLVGELLAFVVGGDVEGAGGVFEELVAQGASPQVDLNRPGVSGGSGLCLYPVGMRRFRAA